MREDRALKLGKRPRRLDPELGDERLARRPIHLERLGLPPRAIEREHQQPAQALAQGVVPHERLELGEHGAVPAERELGLEPLLERGEPQLLEPPDRRLRERLVRDVGERGAAPEAESVLQQADGGLGLGPVERLRGLVRPPLEPVQVEPLRLDVEGVTRRPCLDHLRSEGLAQLGHLTLYLRHGGDRRSARVEVVGQPLDGDDPVRAQQEDRERRALLRPAQTHRAPVVEDLEEVRGSRTRARARTVTGSGPVGTR